MKKMLPCLFSIFSVVAFFGVQYGKAATSLGGDKPQYVENEAIIQMSDSYIEPLANASESEVENSLATTLSDALGDDVQVDLRNFSGSKQGALQAFSVGAQASYAIVKSARISTEELVEKLAQNEDVGYVEPNLYFYPVAENANTLWNMWNNSADAGMNANVAWDRGITGKGVIVAVIDTGAQLTHPDLTPNFWKNPGETSCSDNKDNDGNGYIDDCSGWNFGANNNNPNPVSGQFHGTHVSGTIAAVKDGKGVVGVAPEATIMPLNVFSQGGGASMGDIIDGIVYATNNGADIISMSLGAIAQCDPNSSIARAILNANNAGVFVVAASGNSGNVPGVPATCDHVFAIGATDSSKHIASFSSYYGNMVDVVAPGVNIESTVINGYQALSGTSMATPHVSGAAALILSKKKIAPDALAQAFCNNAEDLGPTGYDEKYGCGFLDVEKAIDAILGTATPNVAVSPSPATQTIDVSQTPQAITASGGSNYTYTLNDGGTGIQKNNCTNGSNATCTLTAPSSSGTATLTVTANGQSVNAQITVNQPQSQLAVSPATQTIDVSQTPQAITASGGSNYTYTLNDGGTGIQKNNCTNGSNATCTLTAPSSSGTATLTVTANGQSVNAQITVRQKNGEGPTRVSLSPKTQIIPVGCRPIPLQASGGTDYRFLISRSSTGIMPDDCKSGSAGYCSLTEARAPGIIGVLAYDMPTRKYDIAGIYVRSRLPQISDIYRCIYSCVFNPNRGSDLRQCVNQCVARITPGPNCPAPPHQEKLTVSPANQEIMVDDTPKRITIKGGSGNRTTDLHDGGTGLAFYGCSNQDESVCQFGSAKNAGTAEFRVQSGNEEVIASIVVKSNKPAPPDPPNLSPPAPGDPDTPVDPGGPPSPGNPPNPGELDPFPEGVRESVQASACKVDILSKSRQDEDWKNKYILEGNDGSAWQRALIAYPDDHIDLEEEVEVKINGTARKDRTVQIFIFTPKEDRDGKVMEPSPGTCFSTQADEAGTFILRFHPRFLWGNFENGIMFDAYFEREEKWDQLTEDEKNARAPFHPKSVKIRPVKNDASCKQLCDLGIVEAERLDPSQLRQELQGSNFDKVWGRPVIIGRMPGKHTFSARVDHTSKADREVLRNITQKALIMEALKRTLLGMNHTDGTFPGTKDLTPRTLMNATSGHLTVSEKTQALVDSLKIALLNTGAERNRALVKIEDLLPSVNGTTAQTKYSFQQPEIPVALALDEILPKDVSTEDLWADDLSELFEFWTGFLTPNLCLMEDDRYLHKNFVDIITKPIDSCDMTFVYGVTPTILVLSEEEVLLEPAFNNIRIVHSETLMKEGKWKLPAGQKSPIAYRYETDEKITVDSVANVCVRKDDIDQLVEAVGTGSGLLEPEKDVIRSELEMALADETGNYDLQFQNSKSIAEHFQWEANGSRLRVGQVFFRAQPGSCERTTLPESIALSIDPGREAFEAGLLP